MSDLEWFNNHLEKELAQLLAGQSSLNQFKSFIYPNAWYLELPPGHPAYEIKLILAEQFTEFRNASDEEIIEELKTRFGDSDGPKTPRIRA